MEQENFSYDPSASIEKGFANVQQNVSNIFSGIIAQKQQDFALADKVFQNLDAITEQTAAIGSARINQGIKNLTKAAAADVYKDGKVNFDALGSISQGVMKIKQLKNYWAGAAEIKKQVLQQAAASNKDMVSLSSFISKLDPLIAENEGGSTTDLQKKIASLYDSHLDYTKIAQGKLTSVIPVDKVEGYMMNSKGGKDSYSFQGLKGMMFDDKTKKVVLPPDEIVTDPATGKPVIDQVTGKPKTISFLTKAKAALSAGDPEFFNNWKRHHGTPDALVSDDAVTMQVINSLATDPQFKELKSKEQLDKEKYEAKTSGIEAKYVEELTKERLKQLKQSIQTAKAQELKYLSGGASSPFPKNYVRPNISKADSQGNRSLSLTKPIVISATGANYVAGKDKEGKNIVKRGVLDIKQMGAPKEFEVTKITKDKNGKFLATGYSVTGSLREKGNARQIVLSKSDYNDFIAKLGGLPPVDRFSNSLSLMELGAYDIPKTYLNIQQDITPDSTGDSTWENVD